MLACIREASSKKFGASDDALSFVQAYIDDCCDDVNKKLRSDVSKSPPVQDILVDVKDCTRGGGQPLTVYRGCTELPCADLHTWVVQNDLTLNGYTSTSLDIRIALYFLALRMGERKSPTPYRSPAPTPYLLRIVIPTEVQGHCPPYISHLYEECDMTWQHELLFPHLSKFKYHSAQTRLVIDLLAYKSLGDDDVSLKIKEIKNMSIQCIDMTYAPAWPPGHAGGGGGCNKPCPCPVGGPKRWASPLRLVPSGGATAGGGDDILFATTFTILAALTTLAAAVPR